MDDLISRQDALEIVERYSMAHMNLHGVPLLGAAAICDELYMLPPVCSEKIRGKWEGLEVSDTPLEEWQVARCSVCGRYHTTPYLYYPHKYAFCPNCGADMRNQEGKE